MSTATPPFAELSEAHSSRAQSHGPAASSRRSLAILLGIAYAIGGALSAEVAAEGDDPVASIDFSTVPEGTRVVSDPITLDGEVVVSGTVRHQGLLQTDTAAPQPYEVSTERYVVEATPAQIGVVVPLDQNIVASLCRDKDGCDLVLQMVNWDGNQIVASRTAHLFLSETTAFWRLSDTDLTSLDGNFDPAGVLFNWDCYFMDAESSAGPNEGLDTTVGFGLLNFLGGTYSDVTTICRIAIDD